MYPIKQSFRLVAKVVEPRTFTGPNNEKRDYTVRRATCLDDMGLPWVIVWPDTPDNTHPLDLAGIGEELELELTQLEGDKGVVRARVR